MGGRGGGGGGGVAKEKKIIQDSKNVGCHVLPKRARLKNLLNLTLLLSTNRQKTGNDRKNVAKRFPSEITFILTRWLWLNLLAAHIRL